MIRHPKTALPWLRPSHILALGWFSYSLGAHHNSGLNLPYSLSRGDAQALAVSALCLCLAMAWRAHLRFRCSIHLIALCCVYLSLSAALITQSHERRSEDQLDIDTISLFNRDEIMRGVIRDVRRSGRSVSLTVAISERLKRSGGAQKQYHHHHLKHPFTIAWRAERLSWKARRGDRVWLIGRVTPISGSPAPELFDASAWWRRRDVVARGRGRALLAQPHEVTDPVDELITRSRDSLLQILDRRPSPGSALVRGLTLGDSSLIQREALSQIRALGLGHLLAVSGLHVGIFAGMVGGLFYLVSIWAGALNLSRWSALGAVIGAWSYVSLAGWPISAQRAAWMISIWAISSWAWESMSSATAVWLAGWLLILFRPSLSAEMGLQLSLAATLSLCAWSSPTRYLDRYRRLEKRLSTSSISVILLDRCLSFMRLSARIAWTTWLMTIPILCWHFGEISMLSPISNMVITPLIATLYLPLVLLSGLLCFFTTYPLELVCIIGDHLIALLDFTPPKTTFMLTTGRYGAVPLGLIALAWAVSSTLERTAMKHYAARLLLDPRIVIEHRGPHVIERQSRARCMKRASISCVVGALLTTLIIVHRPHQATVRFLYVGQGDATLISNGAGDHAMFDVGPVHAGAHIAQRLKLKGVSQLEWVAISHLHPDHYGGLLKLLSEIEVKRVIFHGRSPHTLEARALTDQRSTWTHITDLLSDRDIPLETARSRVHDWGGVKLNWLLTQPPESLEENDASLALLVSGETQRILLSGDLERAGEARLRDVWRRGGYDQQPLSIWQADHHGSATSTLPETLRLLDPKLVVLSLDGTHRFGFPHPQTLSRLAQRGTPWLRLDLHGDFTSVIK